MDTLEERENKININKEELHRKIEEAKQRINELKEIQVEVETNGEISITDPDSRHMKTSNNGTDISHNVQISVDNKSDLVVAIDVTSSPEEQGNLGYKKSDFKYNKGKSIMSKLYSLYLNEKQKNPETLLLFKSGIFYLALDKDAIFLSLKLGFKLTDLNDQVKKCGFPISSSDKYFELIKRLCSFKIIDSTTYQAYNIINYKMEKETLNLLTDISNIDCNNISIIEAYTLLENLKNRSIDILNLGV